MANIEKRVSKAGELSYRAYVRLKGYSKESATFEKLTDARKWAQQTEAAMRENRYFKNTAAKKLTLSSVIDRYLKQVERKNPKRFRDVKPKLEWWKSEIGYCTLSDVSKALLSEKRELLMQEDKDTSKVRTPATVNRYMTVLGHVFTVAVNEWELIESHPMKKLSNLKEPRGRVRFLSDEERGSFEFRVGKG